MPRAPMLAVVVLATFAAACAATQTKDFKLESVGNDEGVLIGNVKIAYNSEPVNSKHCVVCFKSIDKCCLKLDESGDVFLPIKAGKTTLQAIYCVDGSVYHYTLTGAEFEVGPHATKTYFGHVSFEWRTKGGIKASDFFGLIGNVVDLSSNDGSLRMTVSDEVERSIAAFEKQIGKADGLTLKKSIVSVGQ